MSRWATVKNPFSCYWFLVQPLCSSSVRNSCFSSCLWGCVSPKSPLFLWLANFLKPTERQHLCCTSLPHLRQCWYHMKATASWKTGIKGLGGVRIPAQLSIARLCLVIMYHFSYKDLLLFLSLNHQQLVVVFKSILSHLSRSLQSNSVNWESTYCLSKHEEHRLIKHFCQGHYRLRNLDLC